MTLLGAILHVYTDHKTSPINSEVTQLNVFYAGVSSLKNTTQAFTIYSRPQKIVANVLSRAPISDQHFTSTPDNNTFLFSSSAEGLLALPSYNAAQSESHRVDNSYLFQPQFDPHGRHPFHFQIIHHSQQADPSLKKLTVDDPKR